MADDIKALRRENKLKSSLLEPRPNEAGERKKELRVLDQKIEEVKAIKEILLSTINDKYLERKKQQANYAKVLALAESHTAQVKALGLDKVEVFEQYSKLKEELAALQDKADHMSQGRHKKRKMKLQMIEGYRRINDDMIAQIHRQKQLLEEQKLLVQDLADKEADYKRKRELQKRQYQEQLDKLREHYTMTSTLAELELLAARAREPAKTDTFLNRSTRAMETEDYQDESPAVEKGTPQSRRLQPPPRRAARPRAPAGERRGSAQRAGAVGRPRGVRPAESRRC